MIPHVGHLARRDVRHDRDHTASTDGVERKGGAIVARQHGHALADLRDELAAADEVAGGVLDRDDVVEHAEPHHRIGEQIARGARRHVVEYDRQLGRARDRREVLVQTFLARPVVVRRDVQQRVGAGILGRLRQRERFARGIAAGAGDHRHATARGFDGRRDDGDVLFDVERRGLTGRADRDDPVHAAFDLPVNQLGQGVEVDPPRLERRNEGS